MVFSMRASSTFYPCLLSPLHHSHYYHHRWVCSRFMSTDVSRTSDCVSGDMISRHKVRITWVGKRARHRGLSHDYLGIGVRFLRVNAFLWRLGGVVSLNIRCRSVNYFIIISFSSLSFLRSYTYSHIFVPPC